jgi:hypothetical protein
VSNVAKPNEPTDPPAQTERAQSDRETPNDATIASELAASPVELSKATTDFGAADQGASKPEPGPARRLGDSIGNYDIVSGPAIHPPMSPIDQPAACNRSNAESLGVAGAIMALSCGPGTNRGRRVFS